MKKILHVIESLNVGGAEKLLCNTIRELLEYEHLIVSVFKGNDLSMLPPNAKHISLGAKGKATVFLKLGKYRRIVANYRPAFVHAHLYFATVLAKAGTPSYIPLLFTQHFEFSKNITKWYYRFTDRIFSTKKQTCIAVSQTVLKDYESATGFNGEKRVLGICIGDEYFSLEPTAVNSYNGHLKLIALGNVKPIKNQQYLLDAFALLKDLPVSCDVYGEGMERMKLERQARTNNINVFFKGSVNSSLSVLPQYHLYIMPSLTEGFPLALFEAMAASLPAVVSDIPVFHELLGQACDYVSLDAPDQVRLVIEKYLQQSNRLLAKGSVMKKIAYEKASRKAYFSKLRAIYAEAMNGATQA